MTFWIERSRHKARWLLTVASVGCGLGAMQAPRPIAVSLAIGAVIFAIAAFLSWRQERQAYAVVSARAMQEEDAWRRYIAVATPPPWVEASAWWELVAPDFWLVAEQQLVVGDWTIDKYLDQEWNVAELPIATRFFEVDAAAKAAAPRRDDFVPTAPPPSAQRLLSMEDELEWPRCCDAPARLVAGYDVDARHFGDREPPFATLESFGFECAVCGGRYAARDPQS